MSTDSYAAATKPNSFPAIAMMALLAYLPYAEALNAQLQLRFLGYGLLTTVLPTAICMLAIAVVAGQRPRFAVAPVVLAICMLLVVSARTLLGVSETRSFELHQIMEIRFCILLPCYMILSYVASATAWFRNWAPRLIVANGLIAAVIGVLYTLGLFSFKVIGDDDAIRSIYDSGTLTRASGLFAGSNMYAHYLVIAIVMCLGMRWRFSIKTAICLVLSCGVLASESRAALAAAGIAMVWCTWQEVLPLWSRIGRIILLAAALSYAFGLVGGVADFTQDRLSRETIDEDFATRWEKAILGITATTSSPASLLVGARPSETTFGDVTISDNSFVAIITSVGLPFSLLFLFIVGRLFWRMNRWRHASVAYICLAFVASFAALANNAIYWDSWLFQVSAIGGLLGSTVDGAVGTVTQQRLAQKVKNPRELRVAPILQKTSVEL